uniref:Uncharacterized protein n=1 Tax=Aegilops tauschii subsp. strangulata TaxID=200361 RepID=A0A453ISB9_AEGTS
MSDSLERRVCVLFPDFVCGCVRVGSGVACIRGRRIRHLPTLASCLNTQLFLSCS